MHQSNFTKHKFSYFIKKKKKNYNESLFVKSQAEEMFFLNALFIQSQNNLNLLKKVCLLIGGIMCRIWDLYDGFIHESGFF